MHPIFQDMFQALGQELSKSVVRAGKEILPVATDALVQSASNYIQSLTSQDIAVAAPQVALHDQEQILLALMTTTPTHVNDLHHQSHIPIGQLLGVLLHLEMSGKVKQHSGQLFALAN
jgi:predicted Rossmann fold nucleotide-binding protein DprA/Smf involved in DNA uptake